MATRKSGETPSQYQNREQKARSCYNSLKRSHEEYTSRRIDANFPTTNLIQPRNNAANHSSQYEFIESSSEVNETLNQKENNDQNNK